MEMPIVAAVNGSATVHSEYALLVDRSTPLERVLPRASELAGELAARPQLLTRYLAVALWQRTSRRLAEGTALGMALEGLSAADLTYQG